MNTVYTISDLGPSDVLNGRDKTSSSNTGNHKFRNMINASLPRYMSCKTKCESSKVIGLITKDLNENLRFFKRVKGSGGSNVEDPIELLNEKEIRDKIAHALRDYAKSHGKRLAAIRDPTEPKATHCGSSNIASEATPRVSNGGFVAPLSFDGTTGIEGDLSMPYYSVPLNGATGVEYEVLRPSDGARGVEFEVLRPSDGATGVEYEVSMPNRVSLESTGSYNFVSPPPLKRDAFINMEGMQGTASYSNGVSLENDNHQIKNINLQNHQQYRSDAQANDDYEGDDEIKPLPLDDMNAIWRSGEVNMNRSSSKRLSKAKGSWRSGDIDSLMCKSLATMSLDGSSSYLMGESSQSIHQPIGIRMESALQQSQPMSCQTLDIFDSRLDIMTLQSQESKIDMSCLSLNTEEL